MKLLSLLVAVLALGFTLVAGDAQAAKRLGGGQSSGMQRQANPDKSAAPAQAGKNQAAAPQAAPKRSWMGPLAGLAAGLGLAALASHFGFGEALANAMMFGLLALVVMAAVGYFMRRRAMAKQGLAGASGMQFAPAGVQGASQGRGSHEVAMPGSSSATALSDAPVSSASAAVAGAAVIGNNLPADFDKAGFERNAKVNFIRLQAANDAGDSEDIRNFTTPEMYAEIRATMGERGAAVQKTDVVSIHANVVDVAEEDDRYIVTVRFTGLIREDNNASPESVDELWHMTKPRSGRSGWLLAGIQQNQ